MTTPDPFEHDAAVYVLGALDPDDRLAFEEHLAACPDCRDRVEQLRPTVALMAAVRADGFDLEPGPVPDTLLPGLLREAARERSRRRRLTAGLAGLAAACLVALVIVVWPSGSAPKPVAREMTAVRTSPVHATATLLGRKWGTQIDLHCYYDEGVAVSMPYDLVVVDKANAKHDAGSWWLTPEGATDFTGGTSVRPDRIAEVQVTLPDGTPILRLTV
ncbi:MAG TPA: zf-HC2 domain-containing protein [Jatrophihabitans sp.]|uniref:anti-sigma factor family protein n=1 Tax=Jatrophihabitans sp. TaxID=1932789 RepID=UPI002DFC53FD|nr:zf-HC2 domain-containing protein [Jatrophihabitans sp.]